MAKQSSMSPQDYAQSYMKGLGITPIDDVNTDLTFKDAAIGVGSVLPGIGTAMTVSEIEEELKKENPSYGKIVLLGGSELIGLIPGLGTAAKAGLRKVAKKVGANKVVDALDSIPDSKDVAKKQILAGPGAEGYSNRSLYKAQELKAEGYSPKEIEEITGRVQVGGPEDYVPSKKVKYPQVPFKFEIPDKGIIIRKNDGYITLREASKQRPIRVGNLIPTHTKLFEQYPDLKNIGVYIDPKLGSGAHFDITDGSYGSIVIGPEHSGYKQFLADGNVNNPEFRRVFFHELQHAAQAKDFQHAALEQLGGGPDDYVLTASGRNPFGEDFAKAAINNNPKLVEIRDKMIKLFKEDTRGLDATSKVGFKNEVTKVYSNPKTAKKMAELMKELDYESYKTYLQTASEVEAAVVGARAKPTFAKKQPSVSSEVSKRKDVETYAEYAQGYSDSKIKKLLKRMTTRKADLTEEEIESLTKRGVNFVRYAVGIDDKIEGIVKYSEGGLVDTGKKTPEGRIIWNDGGKDYSERTTTFEIDGKWYTMPTVAEDGSQYTSDQIRDYVAKYGPIDFITGEKLPEFKSRKDAEEYATSRSNTRKSFDKGGLATQMDNLFDAEGRRRRKDRPVVEEYVHPLTTVPFFDRPLGASTRDQIKFIDEDGNAHYETVLGDTYTIKLNPDQRRFHQKFQEDVLPVIKEYVKDPKLPTKKQAVDFGKAVLEETVDIASIPGDVLTGKKSAAEITNMDILDLATLTSVGASAFNVPKDSLRMASVAGMFGRKKTPVEEYLTPVEVDLDESKLVDLIDEDAKKFKLFNPRLQNEFNLTYNDVIKQEFKPLKFDETGGRRSTLIDPKIHGNNRLKSYVSNRVLDRYTSLMDDSQVIKSMEFNPAGKEKALNELDDWLKITTDITSNQVKEKFNRFLTEQPGLVLKLSAANKLLKKYNDLDQQEGMSPAEMRLVSSKLRSADNLQQVTMAEILDRFFDETVVYTPDPGQIFKDRKFTFKVTDVDETGAQIQREVSPNFSGAFKDEGWDYGVYNFDEVYGNEGLENTFRNPLARALVMEFGDNVIDPKTKVTYVGERRMLEGEDLTPAETSPEGFDTEVTFQDIVDSIDKKLTDKKEVIDVDTGKFENLGVEILTDFLDKKTGGPYNLNEEKLSETVLGADLLKLLENDPRMNVKNIPEFMKTQEFKNRRITLQDVGEEIIDDFDAATFNVRASPLTTPRYDTYQLQGEAGFEGGAKDKTYEVPIFSRYGDGSLMGAAPGYQPQVDHYGTDTLSHVRFSVYEPSRALRITDQDTGIFDSLIDNKDFILVEELQSDLLAHGYRKFKKIPYTVEKTKRVVDAAIFNRKDLYPEASEYFKIYSDDLSKDITEFFDQLDNTPPQETGKYLPNNPDKGIPDPDKVSMKLANKYTERIQKDIADGKITMGEGDDAQELLSQILTYVQEPGYFASESKYILGNKNIARQRAINKDARRNPKKFGSPPIKKNIESVELNIQTLINQANDMGIDKIVFPHFDMIAAMRFKGASLKAAINNKSIKRDLFGDLIFDNDGDPVLTDGNALYRNYVTDFNKALNKFKTEYPEIKIETGVELPYKPFAGTENLRTDGVVIDISEMKKIYDLEKPKFAEGGVIMKDQMQMAFMQEGGLRDDGMDVDPVSGNEIPSGSMASEVRDDIPAQLSEGEYVVPADVVQYFGVKFFEDLRMEAKRGLADMESNGRIGGEPIDMPMDMPMNQGGMMQTKEQTVPTDTGVAYNVGGMTSNLYNNPTRMDQQVNAVSSNMGSNPQGMDMQNRTQAMMTPEQMDQVNPPPPPRGFNPGGLTGNEAAAYNYVTTPTMPNPMYQTPGASYMYAAPPQLTTTAQETTPSVEYCSGIGMDYDPVTKMCIPRPIEQTPQGSEDNDDPGTNLPKVEPDKWMEDFDYSGTDEGMQNLLQQSLDLLDPPERTGFGGAVAGLLDKGIFGKFSAGSNAAKVAANIIILDHYGVDTTALSTKYKNYVEANLSGVPRGLYNGDSFAKQAAIKHGLSLGRGAVDPFENPIFKSKEDYRKFLENSERKENIRRRYSEMDISPLRSTGKELTEKQKQDAKSDAGLAEAAKIIARQGDDGPTAAQKAAARKRGDEISKRQKEKIIASGDTYSTDTKKALKQMKDRGTFNVGGRNKGGLMKKKKK